MQLTFTELASMKKNSNIEVGVITQGFSQGT